MPTPDQSQDDSVTIGVHTLPVWPADQRVTRWHDTPVLVTQFADHKIYASSLRDLALERSTDPSLAHVFDRSAGVGSAKVYDIEKWPSAAATLVNARAMALFRRATGTATPVVDLSWASIYHDGDFCLPHSHSRTLFSVLYVLDLGEAGGENNGRFYFADPRLAPCCREEAGYVTTPSAPSLTPGTMVLFPGIAIHFVTPYYGACPRITMSWNLNKVARAGEPLPDGVRPKQP